MNPAIKYLYRNMLLNKLVAACITHNFYKKYTIIDTQILLFLFYYVMYSYVIAVSLKNDWVTISLIENIRCIT